MMKAPQGAFLMVRDFGGWLPKVAREAASEAEASAGKAVCLWCVGQASFQQKTRVIQSSFFALVFASTCCPSAPRHGCYFLAFGLVDCCLRQMGQKPKPQPEFVRACWPLPVPYSRTSRPTGQSCTHCQSLAFTGSLPLAGWLWLPQAARNPTLKKAGRLKVKPPAPNHWGATAGTPFRPQIANCTARHLQFGWILF